MESNTEDPTNSSAERIDSDGAAVVDLLEEAWFFGNLLSHGNREHMPRCLPHPCPSSPDCSLAYEMKMNSDKRSSSPEEPCPPVEIEIDGRKGYSSKLLFIHGHSPPPASSSYDDQIDHFHPPSSSSEDTIEEVWAEIGRRKMEEPGGITPLTKRSPSRVLLKAPSLPPGIGREEVSIEEILQSKSHPRMCRSYRQSFLNISDLLPPRQIPKGMRNYRSPMSSEEDMRRRLLGRTRSIKSRGELEFEELQGFKDLGFTFDKKDLSPRVVNILPGLQEKKEDCRVEDDDKEDQKRREPYLSEAWLLSKTFKPQIPTWAHRGSAQEKDVKAHIKFWARAVASNVQPEC
ncbi:hypothetical protein SAY87_031720 [Trapa incisa]|uniref:Uncharacterized protein n=1 Tax=Trapa incisa TaxID=236973 RepID=A0AAN7KVJ1_9MYRT|nr:hypothetical protein SAY87_031720 [Trapa incisa]